MVWLHCFWVDLWIVQRRLRLCLSLQGAPFRWFLCWVLMPPLEHSWWKQTRWDGLCRYWVMIYLEELKPESFFCFVLFWYSMCPCFLAWVKWKSFGSWVKWIQVLGSFNAKPLDVPLLSVLTISRCQWVISSVLLHDGKKSDSLDRCHLQSGADMKWPRKA